MARQIQIDGFASHYEVLNLPHPPVSLKKEELKFAYHRALLKHHPDKSSSSTPSSTGSLKPTSTNAPSTYTVDQITEAYKILSDRAAKSEYDRTLFFSEFRKAGAGSNNADEEVGFRTGLETFDLDDMDMDTTTIESKADGQVSIDIWYRACRCGEDKGFFVSEEDLEREVDKGEIVIGCRGCSLWAKVVFAVHDDTEQDSG